MSPATLSFVTFDVHQLLHLAVWQLTLTSKAKQLIAANPPHPKSAPLPVSPFSMNGTPLPNYSSQNLRCHLCFLLFLTHKPMSKSHWSDSPSLSYRLSPELQKACNWSPCFQPSPPTQGRDLIFLIYCCAPKSTAAPGKWQSLSKYLLNQWMYEHAHDWVYKYDT